MQGQHRPQRARYISSPAYKNRKHEKDKRRQRLQRKPRRGRRGHRGASTNGSRVEPVCTVPCGALGMGKGDAPSPRHISEYPEEEGKRAGSAGANGLNCPDASAGTEPRGHGSGCSLPPRRACVAARCCSQPGGSGAVPAPSQSLIPPDSQASST